MDRSEGSSNWEDELAEHDSLIMDGLSMLARRQDGHLAKLGHTMAHYIATVWLHNRAVPIREPEHKSLARAAKQHADFGRRVYRLWDDINRLANDGHPFVVVDAVDAACIMLMLANPVLIKRCWNAYHDNQEEIFKW